MSTPTRSTKTDQSDTTLEHLDVLVVGAGLAGIGAAHHLQAAFPERTLAIVESRGDMGGTWDLFRYPGVRSDSDMYTLGYGFKPWREPNAIADGESILRYLKATAAEEGIDRRIRFHRRVVQAEWSSQTARWTVTLACTDTAAGEEPPSEPVTEQLTCSFLMCCSGYYRYDEGYAPGFPGLHTFEGTVVHPQHWPEDLDYTGKRIVVIGSGATAITLVPALAPLAAHVTMLQRSPTYIVSQPTRDALTDVMRRRLPDAVASKLIRGRYLTTQIAFYELCRRRPRLARALLRRALERQLPDDVDFDTHFRPSYDPWDQRLCVVPGGDLFRAIRGHKVEVVTDHIESFTPTGLRLHSGRELEADLVVTATGLNLLAFGGIALSVDGREVRLPESMAYKAMMLSDVPNFAFVVGYTNASWTLKVDLVCEYVVRLLRHMDRTRTRICVPPRDPTVREEPLLDFSAGYVLRSLDRFPTQGDRAPWRLRMNYFVDRKALRREPVDDGVMTFTNPDVERPAAVPVRKTA